MAATAEKRRAQRRDMRYKATIENVVDGSLTACLIHDVSATGAKIAIPEGAEVQDPFILHLAPGGGSRRICRVVWRRGSKIGLAFANG